MKNGDVRNIIKLLLGTHDEELIDQLTKIITTGKFSQDLLRKLVRKGYLSLAKQFILEFTNYLTIEIKEHPEEIIQIFKTNTKFKAYVGSTLLKNEKLQKEIISSVYDLIAFIIFTKVYTHKWKSTKSELLRNDYKVISFLEALNVDMSNLPREFHVYKTFLKDKLTPKLPIPLSYLELKIRSFLHKNKLPDIAKRLINLRLKRRSLASYVRYTKRFLKRNFHHIKEIIVITVNLVMIVMKELKNVNA